MNEVLDVLLVTLLFCFLFLFATTTIVSIRSFLYLRSHSNNFVELQKSSVDKIKDSYEEHTHEIIELQKKIDELRLQVGIVSGRMGDYGRLINIPTAPALVESSERKKPGPKPGSKRKPKEFPQSVVQ